MKAGSVGQIKGPFKAGSNIFNKLFTDQGVSTERMKLGISMDDKDLLPFGDVNAYPTGFSFTVVGSGSSTLIQMGRTGIYETDGAVQISSLSFTNDAPQSVIVNYVIY